MIDELSETLTLRTYVLLDERKQILAIRWGNNRQLKGSNKNPFPRTLFLFVAISTLCRAARHEFNGKTSEKLWRL